MNSDRERDLVASAIICAVAVMAANPASEAQAVADKAPQPVDAALIKDAPSIPPFNNSSEALEQARRAEEVVKSRRDAEQPKNTGDQIKSELPA